MADTGVALDAWSCAGAAPDSIEHPKQLDEVGLDWVDYRVPGTIAGALRAAGRWPLGDRDLDAEDWWLRTSFTSSTDTVRLSFDGIATIADVWVNGEHVLDTANMFRHFGVDVDVRADEPNELVVLCHALRPLLAARRPRPRWRTALVADQNLRCFRTSLLGRTASRPPCAPVGLWRAVRVQSVPPLALRDERVAASLDGDDGVVRVTGAFDGSIVHAATLVCGDARVAADVADGRIDVTLRLAGVERWWPSTHGTPALHPLHLECRSDAGRHDVQLRPVGFRTIDVAAGDAPAISVNGTPIFCRGAVWAPIDPVALTASDDELRGALEQMTAAGMNMVRISGDTVPESPRFYDLCDELGLLVWHDLMFARLDYPDDDEFVANVTDEIISLFGRLQGRPSVAVVCGANEVAQQAAMRGAGALVENHRIFDDIAPRLVDEHLAGVAYVAHTPGGGDRPFSVDRGIAHYFGVGAYRRPLSDARLAAPKFVSECLALANVPCDEAVDELLGDSGAIGDPSWKQKLPRDPGCSWDFEDIRDHYVRDLFGVDPLTERIADPEHYLDLGRAASVAAMSATVGEWRRPASTCNGALVLSLRDLDAGSGWGVIDSAGRPKAAYYALRRISQPRALLLADEGLNGLDLWVLNDLPAPATGTLSIRTFCDTTMTAHIDNEIRVEPHSFQRFDVETMLGGFTDVTHAYAFGPQGTDVIAVEWRDEHGVVARTIHHVRPAPMHQRDVGLAATVRPLGDDRWELDVTSRDTARCVLISAPGCTLSDNAFDIEPGGRVTAVVRSAAQPRGRVRAVNGRYSAPIKLDQS